MGLLQTIKREYKFLKDIRRVLAKRKLVDPDSGKLICDFFEEWADKYGPNIAFLEDDKSLTFMEFDNYANQVASWALDQGYRPGDTAAVFVQNRMEYVALWLGLTKAGVIPALINFQLIGPALAHCVNISEAKHVIVDAELMEAWESAASLITHPVSVVSAFGDLQGYDSFDAAIARLEPKRPARAIRDGIIASDQCMKMYTSGTTGMPKAAKITHVRAQNYMLAFGAAANTGPEDRMMMVLPLYHATGGFCGVGAAISNGGSVVIRRKFSASSFWDDCVKYEATLFMYVGEICRFLLSAPPDKSERKHKLQWIIGNGLRPEVWPEFVKRFNIPHVVEFYGATEGNVSLINIDGPVGAVGRLPDYLAKKFNTAIIEYDVESNSNIRGTDGFCIKVDNNDIGELIGEIREDEARFRFEGYENEDDTSKKILRDVFVKGDAWFRTGDLLKRDDLGYYYFMDRVGDTFRWKAENVATGEVAAAIADFTGVTQANVYGVKVPGYDGRAGMAAIVSDTAPDLTKLKAHIDDSLPHYARPVFLRLSAETETTSTFKFKKTNLVKAGFNPENVHEPLYYADPVSRQYVELDTAAYQAIISGIKRL